MDQITGRNEDGNLLIYGEIVKGCRSDTVYNALLMLEEYENTGLSPDEIEQRLCEQELSPEAAYAIDKHADDLIERLNALNKSLDKSIGNGTTELVRPQEEKSTGCYMCRKRNMTVWASNRDGISFNPRFCPSCGRDLNKPVNFCGECALFARGCGGFHNSPFCPDFKKCD